MKRSIFLFIFLLIGIFLNITSASAATVTISADYCSLGFGNVKLSATSGFASYQWNTGDFTSSITVHQSGMYSVTVTDALGNTSSASLQVGTELVTNGDFSAGNTGFTTNYTYNQNSLIAEGAYTITTNANIQHPYFHGTAHTNPGTGYFMAINGDTVPKKTAWQEVITVVPNTIYYFSTWAMGISAYSDPTLDQAQLQFSINGSVLGSLFQVTPYVWNQFYTSWNSGSNTTATIKIIDMQTATGGNDFGLDNISFSTLSPISLAISASNDSPTCQGSTLNLSATVTGGTSPLTYSWNGADSFTSTLQNPTLANASSSMAGKYYLTVKDTNGCMASDSTVVSIQPLATGTLSNDGPVCPKGSANLTFTAASGKGPYDLTINGTNYSNINSGDKISVVPGLTSTYTLTLITDKGTAPSCANTVNTSTTITVVEDTTWPMLLSGDTLFCTGNSTTLTASGAVAYLWNTGATTPSISVQQADTYKVIGTNTKGCEKKDSITIHELALPLANFTLSTTKINNKADYTTYRIVSQQQDVTYTWDFGDGTTDTQSAGIHYFTNVGETDAYTITLTATNQNGCVNKSSQSIVVIPFIPNVFSPNGDGYNDYFMPYYDVQVFDRNGMLIYQGDKNGKGWDGTYKNKKMDPDTYFYVLHYVDGHNVKQTVKGFVTLVR